HSFLTRRSSDILKTNTNLNLGTGQKIHSKKDFICSKRFVSVCYISGRFGRSVAWFFCFSGADLNKSKIFNPDIPSTNGWGNFISSNFIILHASKNNFENNRSHSGPLRLYSVSRQINGKIG